MITNIKHIIYDYLGIQSALKLLDNNFVDHYLLYYLDDDFKTNHNNSIFINSKDLMNDYKDRKPNKDFDELIVDMYKYFKSKKKIKTHIIYLTDKNKEKYMSINKENVEFFGPVKEIGNFWLKDCFNIKTATFSCLINLESVGCKWLDYCKNLIMVEFEGMENLKSVGIAWLSDCINLKKISFNNLINLESVDCAWMQYCIELEYIDLKLYKLKSIGDNFTKYCDNIKQINYSQKLKNYLSIK